MFVDILIAATSQVIVTRPFPDFDRRTGDACKNRPALPKYDWTAAPALTLLFQIGVTLRQRRHIFTTHVFTRQNPGDDPAVGVIYLQILDGSDGVKARSHCYSLPDNLACIGPGKGRGGYR